MASLGNCRHLEGGNTVTPSNFKKQPNRATFYCFTHFNFETDVINRLHSRLNEICKKWLYGEESCPTTGKKHLQGWFKLKKPMRITELKLAGNPHLETCKGDEEENIAYCSKEGKVVSHGFPKPIKIATTLRPWQEKVIKIIKSEPDDRKIYWFWESTGGVGKSTLVKYAVVKHDALFCDGGKKADIINLVFNNDMDTCNTIIWDIPRVNRNAVSYAAIEAIKNGLVCNTKYETGVKVFNPPHIIIFANFPPDLDEDNLSKDRWMITELKT